MLGSPGIQPPVDLDWQNWIVRWDKMQERYLVQRQERFDEIVRLTRASQQTVSTVVDLGCGTGSLMVAVLDAFPEAAVTGIDFDPTLLWLAQARLDRFGWRSHIELKDLRKPDWTQAVIHPVDAVVSATALHWLTPIQLDGLYEQIAAILRPGGIFLNADHAGSLSVSIQREWENHRSETLSRGNQFPGEDWDGFWAGYTKALKIDAKEIHQRVIGGWDGGVESGLPITWHLDRLRDHGFIHVDCFWRSDCDAIYGGVRAS